MALLRVVHAVPGAGMATLDVMSGGKTFHLGPIGFAQTSRFTQVGLGPFKWTLVGSNGKALMSGSGRIGRGTWTGVLMYRSMGPKSVGVMLHVYKDQAGVPGKTLIRVIHSAPEFGNPSLKFDSTTVMKRLSYMMSTPYMTVPAGTHSLAAMGAGNEAGLSVKGVKLNSGLAYTEIVVGTRGQRVHVVTLVDRGSPLTRPAPSSASSAMPTMATPHGPRWVVVRPGDSLWTIARRRCGATASASDVSAEVVRIWDANVGRIGTGDPNLIFPGQRLHMPLKA